MLTPQQFSEVCAAELRAAAPELTVEITGPLTLRAKRADGRYADMSLREIYGIYRNDPALKQSVIASHVSASLRILRDVRIDPERIIPVVRPRALLENATKPGRGGAPAQNFIFEPLNDDLAVGFVEDLPTSVRFLTPEDLAASGLSRDKLRALAIKNLRRMLKTIDSDHEDGVYTLDVGGIYESSLILLPDLWSAANFDMKGEIVIAIPTRSHVMIADSADKNAVRILRKAAREAFAAGPYGITPKLFIYRAGRLDTLP